MIRYKIQHLAVGTLLCFIALAGSLTAQTARVYIDDIQALHGDMVAVDIKVEGFEDIIGTTFKIAWDSMLLDFVEINDVALDLTVANNFNTMFTSSGSLAYLYFDESLVGSTLADGEKLFTVVYEVLGNPGERADISFTSTLEVINSMEQVLNVNFDPGAIIIVTVVDTDEQTLQSLFQATPMPNPFTGDASINISMPLSGKLQWELFDAAGKELVSGIEHYLTGDHVLRIGKQYFSQEGTYLLQLTAGNTVQTKQLLFVKQ